MARVLLVLGLFFFSSRSRHTRFDCDWSSDVCSSDLAQGCDAIAGSEHGRGAAHQITGPHKVISAVVRITLCFSPRNRERSNQGTRIRLVFMTQKQTEAAVV